MGQLNCVEWSTVLAPNSIGFEVNYRASFQNSYCGFLGRYAIIFFLGTPPSGGKPAGAEAILVSTWSSRRQLYTPSQVLTEEVATSAECL